MRPYKSSGWGHGVYEDSIRKKEVVGTYRLTQSGRGYRYILAGGVNLAVGKATSSVGEATANLLNQAVGTGQDAAIGDYVIKFTAGGTVALTLNELEGGI